MNIPLKNFDTAMRAVELVCSHFGVFPRDLEGPSREWHVTWPRFVAIALVRQHTTYPVSTIALLFNRSKGAVIAACSRVEEEVQTTRKARSDLSTLDYQLSTSTKGSR